MNPRVKSYVYLAPTPEGVYIAGGVESMYLAGRGIGPLLSRFMTTLDGSRPLASLEQAMPEKVRPLFSMFVNGLIERGLVQDVAARGDAELPAAWLQVYGDTIDYLADQTPAYRAAFHRWRARRILLAGSGYALKTAARSLARSGVGRLTITLEGGDDERVGPDEAVRALADHRTRCDPDFTYEVVEAPAFLDGAADPDLLVLYVSDTLRPDRRGSILGRLCAEARRNVAVGGALDGVGLVVPAGPQGAGALLRLRARLHGRGAGAGGSVTAGSLIGAAMAFGALKFEAGLAGGIVATPAAPAPGFLHVSAGGHIDHHLGGLVLDDGDGEPVVIAGEADLRAALEPLFDPLVGLFSDDEDSSTLVPLAHSKLRVHGAGGAVQVCRWGESVEGARAAALLAAAEACATLAERATGEMRREPVVAHFDAALWQAQALAQAIALCPQLNDLRRTVEVDLRDPSDPRLRLVLRFCRVFGHSPPRVYVTHVPGLASYAAAVSLGGLDAVVVRGDALEAVRGALGELCSRLQDPARPEALGRDALLHVHGPGASAARALPGLTELEDLVDEGADPAAFGLRVEPRPHTAERALQRAGLVVGALTLVAA